MSAGRRRFELLHRVRSEARDAAARHLAAAREALAVAEQAVLAADARVEIAADRISAARRRQEPGEARQVVAEWRLREAWMARLRRERLLLAGLGEALRRTADRHRPLVESARQEVVTRQRAVEVADRCALREAARARRARDRDDDR